MKGVNIIPTHLIGTIGSSTVGICVDTHVHRISNRLGWVKTWNKKNPKSQDPEKTRKVSFTISISDWKTVFQASGCGSLIGTRGLVVKGSLGAYQPSLGWIWSDHLFSPQSKLCAIPFRFHYSVSNTSFDGFSSQYLLENVSFLWETSTFFRTASSEQVASRSRQGNTRWEHRVALVEN